MENKDKDVVHKIYKTKEGMKLILVNNPHSNIFMCKMHIKIGSFDENNEELGVAHFLEHLMFKGSNKYKGNEITTKLDEIGAIYNASTSFDYTDYYIYGQNKDKDIMLDILIDMFFNPLIPEDSIETERKIIIEEYNMRFDSAQFIQLLNIIDILTEYKNKLTRRPVIGTIDTINSLDYNKIINFRKKYNDLNKVSLTIVSKINFEEMLDNVSKMCKMEFKEYEYESKQIVTSKEELIYKVPTNFCFFRTNSSQINIFLCFPSYKMYDERRYSLSIISDILTNGTSGRITDRLRERNGLSYSQHSGLIDYGEISLFYIDVGVSICKAVKAIKLICKEINKLKRLGVLEGEFNKSKNKKMLKLLINNQNQLSYLEEYSDSVINNSKIKMTDDIIEIYKKLSIKDLMNVIEEIFDFKKMYASLYGPNRMTENQYNEIIKKYI